MLHKKQSLALTKIQQIPGLIDAYYKARLQLLEGLVISSISDASPELITKAKISHDGYKKWSPNTYQAFIRHDGNYQTKAQTKTSWNAEFLKSQKTKMKEVWPVFESSHEQLWQSCYRTCDEEIQNCRHYIKSEPEFRDDTSCLTNFGDYLGSSIARLRDVFAKESERIAKLFNGIRLAATTDCVGSYFMKSMLEAYKACQNVPRLYRLGGRRRKFDVLWLHIC